MWTLLTIEDYLDIVALEDEDLTPTEFFLERLEIVTGVDYSDIDDDELQRLEKEFSWLNKAPKFPEYSGGFVHLHFGAFIDLERLITKQAPISKIDEIVLTIQGYDVWENDIHATREMLLCDAVPIMEKYITYRNNLIDKYKGLFEDEDDEPDEDEQQPTEPAKWVWERMIYELCKGDITKAKDVIALPHLMVLNWLSMVKDLKLNQPTPTVESHS